MPELTLFRKLLFGAAAALGLAGGAAGIAVAQSSGGPPAVEAEEGDDDRDPSYTSSITAPEDPKGQSEADEAAALASLATITEAQAGDIALGAVPGEVTEIELGNENGGVAWSVDVTATDGSAHEVVVDAGNGDVLAQEADDDGEAEDGDAEDEGGDDEEAESAEK